MKAKKKRQPVRPWPLPEAVTGNEWEVRDTGSVRQAYIGLNHVQGRPDVMGVPLDDDPRARLVRLHEMTHAKITPRNADHDGLPDDIVNLCEDARVHGHMNRLDFRTGALEGVISDFELSEIARTAHESQLAAYAASMTRTGELARLTQKVAALDGEQADRRSQVVDFGSNLAETMMHDSYNDTPGFERTVEMAHRIVDTFGDPRKPNEEQPPSTIPDELLSDLAQVTPEALADVEDPWYPMLFETPPLPLKLPGKLRGRNRKRVDIRGRRMHRVGRLHIDGRVFATRPPTRHGGAVLIDTSGSMSLTPDDVLNLCVAYPAGIIGAYSTEGDQGYLRVIARNGRRVPDDQISPPGSGNGVDGPALQWLARQPGPRFWISDGHVEGGIYGVLECDKICRANQISRVANAWEILGKE